MKCANSFLVFVVAHLFNVFELPMLHEVYLRNVKVFLKHARHVIRVLVRNQELKVSVCDSIKFL